MENYNTLTHLLQTKKYAKILMATHLKQTPKFSRYILYWVFRVSSETEIKVGNYIRKVVGIFMPRANISLREKKDSDTPN